MVSEVLTLEGKTLKEEGHSSLGPSFITTGAQINTETIFLAVIYLPIN